MSKHETNQANDGLAGAQPNRAPTAEVAATPRQWHHSLFVIIPCLLALYPVGLVLLYRRQGGGVWLRWIAALLTLPPFVILMLVALNPYWHFDGGMSFGSFRLDFGRGGQAGIVEAHRESQSAAAASQPRAELMSLDWPAFRGALRDGVIRNEVITTDWKKDPPRLLWRQPVGEGHSSFVVGNGRLYTMEQRRRGEAVTCYDIDTGREIWAHIGPGFFQEPLGDNGPRATPTLDGDRIYALGAAGEFCCLNALDGKRIWTKNILREFGASNLQWAMSASPLIVDDFVVVTNSGVGGGSIMAYRKSDGSLAWKNEIGQQAYSSPMLVTMKGRRQILNIAARNVNSLDPVTGRALWSFPWATDMGISCSQPVVVDDERIFVSLGYGIGSVMIKLEGEGDAIKPKALWTNYRMSNKFSSSVIHRGTIYGLDERVLACQDLDTGEIKWKGGRYGYGSLLLVGDHLLVSCEDGELALVEATPEEHREIGMIKVFDERTWNNSALAGGLFFTRNHREMACYDMRPTKN